MPDGRISEITGTKSLTGGVGTLDYVVKWYYIASPSQTKVFEINNMPPDDFETELDIFAAAEGVTFI